MLKFQWTYSAHQLHNSFTFVFSFYFIFTFLSYFWFSFFSLAQLVKILMAVAIYLTYSLMLYVPSEIMWPHLRTRFHSNRAKRVGEYAFRAFLVLITCKYGTFPPLYTDLDICHKTLGYCCVHRYKHTYAHTRIYMQMCTWTHKYTCKYIQHLSSAVTD